LLANWNPPENKFDRVTTCGHNDHRRLKHEENRWSEGIKNEIGDLY
jgi:hypothetical protein